MKKKLLYLTSIVLFSVTAINAQTTVWDFGNSTSKLNDGSSFTSWPLDAVGVSANKTVDLLGLFPGASSGNFGKVNTGSSGAFVGDSYTAGIRFQLGGGGGVTSPAKPTAKYLSFNVSGACTVKVWAKTSTNTAIRNLYVTDGTTQYGVGTTNSGGNGDTAITNATVTAAGTLYIYSDAGHNLYKIEVSGATVSAVTLGTSDFDKADSKVTVFGTTGKINIGNITSATKISVYSVSGALVKSTETSGDVSLSAKKGAYIVKAQSEEGVKTVKVLVK